jgi:hypothetical protein
LKATACYGFSDRNRCSVPTRTNFVSGDRNVSHPSFRNSTRQPLSDEIGSILSFLGKSRVTQFRHVIRFCHTTVFGSSQFDIKIAFVKHFRQCVFTTGFSSKNGRLNAMAFPRNDLTRNSPAENFFCWCRSHVGLDHIS